MRKWSVLQGLSLITPPCIGSANVVIDPEYRGRGLGKKLIQTITEMDELKEMFGILATRDAHGLYEKYGFQKVPDKFMRRNAIRHETR